MYPFSLPLSIVDAWTPSPYIIKQTKVIAESQKRFLGSNSLQYIGLNHKFYKTIIVGGGMAKYMDLLLNIYALYVF